MNTNLDLDPTLFEAGANLMRAINHRLRKQMLHHIHKKGRVTVNELKEDLNLDQPAASWHLAILRNEKFVVTKREGKFICYSINYNRLRKVQAQLKEMLDLENR